LDWEILWVFSNLDAMTVNPSLSHCSAARGLLVFYPLHFWFLDSQVLLSTRQR